jgi:hypothetical protein
VTRSEGSTKHLQRKHLTLVRDENGVGHVTVDLKMREEGEE